MIEQFLQDSSFMDTVLNHNKNIPILLILTGTLAHKNDKNLSLGQWKGLLFVTEKKGNSSVMIEQFLQDSSFMDTVLNHNKNIPILLILTGTLAHKNDKKLKISGPSFLLII